MAFIEFNPKLFFDSEEVIKRMDAKTIRVLNGTGLRGRDRMKGGMKSGGRGRNRKHSNRGEYPRYHAGRQGGLRGNILYQADPTFKSVVIGPRRFPLAKNTTISQPTVPALLNEGGVGVRLITYRQSTRPTPQRLRKIKRAERQGLLDDRRKGRRRKDPRGRQVVRYAIAPRPFVLLTRKPTEERMLQLMERTRF